MVRSARGTKVNYLRRDHICRCLEQGVGGHACEDEGVTLLTEAESHHARLRPRERGTLH